MERFRILGAAAEVKNIVYLQRCRILVYLKRWRILVSEKLLNEFLKGIRRNPC